MDNFLICEMFDPAAEFLLFPFFCLLLRFHICMEYLSLRFSYSLSCYLRFLLFLSLSYNMINALLKPSDEYSKQFCISFLDHYNSLIFE